MKEPEQWAIKQHLEKNPKCEWICTHTNQENLGEQLPEMEVYKPSLMRSFVIESDSVNGDIWFAHYDDFINVVESDEVAFAPTPQEALQKLIDETLPAHTNQNTKKG